MGHVLRHYLALMKKNGIIWRRTLGASLCELFCPVILMFILSVARMLVEKVDFAAQSNLTFSQLYYPMDHLHAANTTAAATNLSRNLQPFLNFSGIQQIANDPVYNFFPMGCKENDNDDARTIIAFSGNSNLTDQVVRDIMKIHEQQRLLPSQATQRINGYFMNSYTYQRFESHQAILDYIAADGYMDKMTPGVCFGFSLTEKGNDDYKLEMIFNDRVLEGAQMILPQLLSVASSFINDQDTISFLMYARNGYSYIPYWIANRLLQRVTNKASAHIAITLVPFKTDSYFTDDFEFSLNRVLPFFLLLIYILPVYRLISNVVAEKESRMRESMKMMGLSDFSYWLSWWTYYFLVVTIITAICVGMLSINIITYSDHGIVFLFLWAYGCSLFGMCILLQSFFESARVAGITGTLIYFGTAFLTQVIQDPSIDQQFKNLGSLVPTIAVYLGSGNGQGLTNETIWKVYANYRFVDSIIYMTISLVITFWVGIYFDNVLPSAYGLRKPWYFCFTKSYWFGANQRNTIRIHNKRSNASQSDLEQNSIYDFETKYMKRENFEPPSNDLIAQEKDNKILKIQELKKTFDNGFQAVKGVNVKMYNGQIFALLGHNGAGKTTALSMLTGLLSSTSGQCEVFGHDLFNDMTNVRRFLGVCPQHNVLFDLLTPEEHLDIFCDFKGVDKKTKKEEIKKIMIDVDVYPSKDIEARNLSGGNKRKLSVAIALVGGSKFVLLDEPTAGMDLSARRRLWNMLKNYKSNRIIILTTHHMDEADILGDRIGIMTAGKVVCLGSSLFLKNRFGVGYNLTMVKKEKQNNTLVGIYLEEHIGDVKKLSEVSSEITYQIPTALSHKFKDFFQLFDNDLEKLGISSYGISVTTLEEVFLQVSHIGDGEDNAKIKDQIKQKKEAPIDQYDDYSIADNHETGTWNIFKIHMNALFRKRFNIYKRNYKALVLEIIVPVILVLIGFGFSKVQFFFQSPKRLLSPIEYPLKQRIQANLNLMRPSGYDFSPRSIIGFLPMINSSFDVNFRDYSQISTNNGSNEHLVLEVFDNNVFESRLVQPYEPYRYGSYFIYEANRNNMQFKASCMLNLTSQDNLRLRAAQSSGIFIVFVVSIGFALIPAGVISFLLNEREKNVKQMQLISGLDLFTYWINNFCFDIVKSIIPCVIVIGLMYAFDLGYNYVWIMFLLFPLGVIPFTYVTSFCFTSENLAQNMTIFIHFVFAGILAIIAGVLRVIPETWALGDLLVGILKIMPSYCLTDSIMWGATKDRLKVIRTDNFNVQDLDLEAIGGNIMIICIHGVFWTIMLILIETRAFKWVERCFSCFYGRKVPINNELVLDDDVLKEEKRVENLPFDQIKVRVDKFRKGYERAFKPMHLAVERTSFGLDYGECFALLGVNGAGKTTTFKSLTGEIAATSGLISINGMDIQRDFTKVRKLIGYCPQHDAIFDQLTVEEHLDYYARIKGIKKELITVLVEKQIQDMNLEEHRTKLAGALSGGNKRKLSVAICVIGNPPIILLDEPSAGMDPEARRFMWSVVARISQQRKKSAVILTTHSMEEAEALSTKMGIMVQGGIFKCFGSSQHIKSKFGTGYEIVMKVRKIKADELTRRIKEFGLDSQETIDFTDVESLLRIQGIDDFLIKEIKIGGLGNDVIQEADEHNGKVNVRNLLNWVYVQQCGQKIIAGLVDDFDEVELLENFNDFYKVRVPKGDKSIGFVFSLIDSKKDDLNISEYSASQTTLEQIFQMFANIKFDEVKRLIFDKKNGAYFKTLSSLKIEDLDDIKKSSIQ